ncbi:MAG: GNAT family N-acetyltransferase [Lachnospiraceae bacterium]|nr:GNAT family N-acetyltransferase [Lachnospiraceae bacterium]
MQFTRIEAENEAYFAELLPEDMRQDDSLLKLGLLDGKNVPICALALDVWERMAYLKWVYTDPDKRGKGAASALLEKALSLFADLPFEGMEADFLESDYEIEALLEARGFLTESVANIYSVPILDLMYADEMDVLVQAEGKRCKAKPLSDEAMREKFLEYMRTHGISRRFLSHISEELCPIVAGKDGEVKSGMLVREEGRYDLAVNYLFGNGNVRDMVNLLVSFYELLVGTGRTDGNLRFTSRQSVVLEYIEKLTGEERSAYRLQGIRHAVRLF